MSADRGLPLPSKHRLEALTDGIYAIALTLLVLELKIPQLPAGASEAMLGQALIALLPKGLTWLLSFWVMAMFWLAHLRLYRLTTGVDSSMIWTELVQLALISLLPFSTALIGEHGTLRPAAAIYSAHLLGLSVLSLYRTSHVLGHPELHAADVPAGVARALRIRGRVLVGCTLAALLLAFVVPGPNMFAMLPTALLSRFVRVRPPAAT